MPYPILDHPDYFTVYGGRVYWFQFNFMNGGGHDGRFWQLGKGGVIAAWRITKRKM
jgi:hypothetical protein